jgi:zinc/manganese transport system substrate-binding protein
VAGRTLVAVLLALTATGCATASPSAAGGPLTVVATTSAWGSILAQLGGSRVHAISLITNPNTDPHDYEPTPADARALSVARLVVENGVGYDAWAARVLAASPDSHRLVVNVGDLVGARPDGNPHLWYSPADVRSLAGAVTTALEKVDPADATYFARQRERFDQQGLARYDALVAGIRMRYAGVPFGASESVVAPLADALGLDLLTPADFLRAISEGIDPSADDKTTADRQIREHAIKVFVVNRQNSTPDVTALTDAALAAGIPVVEVTETLTPAGATYQDWQVAQLERLRAALHRATGR